MRTILAILFMLLATQVSAANKEIVYGNVSLKVPIPEELCEVKNNGITGQLFKRQADLQAIANMKLLAYFADCKSVKSFINIDTFTGSDEGAVIVASVKNGNREVVYNSLTKLEFNKQLVAELSDVPFDEIIQKAQNVLDELTDYDPKIVEPTNLGVLAIDDAVYHGLIMPVKLDDDLTVAQATVTSMVLINGVIMGMYKYRNYTDQDTIKDLLSESQLYIKKLEANN